MSNEIEPISSEELAHLRAQVARILGSREYSISYTLVARQLADTAMCYPEVLARLEAALTETSAMATRMREERDHYRPDALASHGLASDLAKAEAEVRRLTAVVEAIRARVGQARRDE